MNYSEILKFKRETIMRKFFTAIAAAVILAACSDPKEIVFGSDPMKQISEQGDKFKKLSEEDRGLLVRFLSISTIGKAFGEDIKPVTGRTVGEVLTDARAWREKVNIAAAEEKKRVAEAEVLKAKVLAERKVIAEKISSSVVVAVVDKTVLPVDHEAGRYSAMLKINYAIENKSTKDIAQIKGNVIFKDATGDMVGSLFVDFDQPVGAGKILKTSTGRGWELNKFMNGEIEKIAGREFSGMKATFEPESIAFKDGEVLKAPEIK